MAGREAGGWLEHECHPALLDRRHQIRVALVGAGGNGSRVLSGLRHLHLALLAEGREGLHVTLFDPDAVSEANLARQAFYPSDVGANKAVTLVNRLNLACGLTWEARPVAATRETLEQEDRTSWSRRSLDIVVACVDTRRAKSEVAAATGRASSCRYLMDLGNDRTTGQVVLGQPLNGVNRRSRARLRTAYELFPELVDTSLPEDDEPSCSTAEALERQDLYLNDALAAVALNLLSRLLRRGRLPFHGTFVNLETGSGRPLRVEPKLWDRLRRSGRLGGA